MTSKKTDFRSMSAESNRISSKLTLRLVLVILCIFVWYILILPTPGLVEEIPDSSQRQQVLKSQTDSSFGLNGLQSPEMHDAMMHACKSPISLTPVLTFEEFVPQVCDALDTVVVGQRPIEYLEDHFDEIWERHGALKNGFWAEFGVYQGATLNRAYEKVKHTIPVFAGFDSFKGLPVTWRPGFGAGIFATAFERVRSALPNDIELYEGWFQNTVQEFLGNHPRMPAALVHHDGDLFVSTSITFSLLSTRIVPGSVMCFDELLGYPSYQDHEILSLFVWMQEFQATLCPLAISKPTLPADRQLGKGEQRTREWRQAIDQSACFQVLSMRTRLQSGV
jgi:hypothetical protein